MKKLYSIMLVAVLLMLGWAGQVPAMQFGPIPVNEAALRGAATHKCVITWKDFTQSTTNTAQQFSNAIPAGAEAELIAVVVDQGFDTGNTNFTGSTVLIIGDGSATDLFLTATQLSTDNTNVSLALPRLDAGTISVSLETKSMTLYTNVSAQSVAIGSTNVVTNIVTGTFSATVVTNATATFSGTAKGVKYYSADGFVYYTFTPNAEEALSANTSGGITTYWRIWLP